MPKLSHTALLAVVLTAAAMAAARGSSSAAPLSGAGAARTSGDRLVAATISPAGSGSVDVQIAIDRRALVGASPALMNQYLAAAMTTAELPVDRGGTLTITTFGSVGVRPVTVYQAKLPPLSQEGDGTRGSDEAGWRAGIDAAVRVAVGLSKAASPYAQELAALTAEPGDDVARALAEQLEEQPTEPHTPDVIEILTEGLVDEHDLNLYAGVAGHRPVSALAALIARQAEVPTATRRATLVILAPVGMSSTGGLGPILTQRLVASWTLALRSLPIAQSDVSPTTI